MKCKVRTVKNGQTFESYPAVKNEVQMSFFASKSKASSKVECFNLPKDGTRSSNEMVDISLINAYC